MEILVTAENRAKLLAALYNASTPQGLGFLQHDPTPMTENEAASLLEEGTYFDYLKGRVMKTDLRDGVLNTRGYNRDNGPDAAETAWEAALAGDEATITAMHDTNLVAKAEFAKEQMSQQSGWKSTDGTPTLVLGLADMADELAPAVDAAVATTKQNQ